MVAPNQYFEWGDVCGIVCARWACGRDRHANGKDASDTFPAFASGPEGGESPPVGDATATGDPQGVTPPKKT